MEGGKCDRGGEVNVMERGVAGGNVIEGEG